MLSRGVPAPNLPASLNGIRVSGNQLVDGNDKAVHLQGINRSGTEYACVQGWGIFDGPSDRMRSAHQRLSRHAR
jgi:hypothetical protein